ncbi:hypothetical protein B0H16DRAFT_1882606 [Mycena metata]|uniref:Uncharacterized protein n=1 Tax=Mycena metata TaxID=1033252 RepID=A0AAD7JNU4_9AGAR|nr:hypothetical protein B0H16DRAFT_1882606 [Mycena metata]
MSFNGPTPRAWDYKQRILIYALCMGLSAALLLPMYHSKAEPVYSDSIGKNMLSFVVYWLMQHASGLWAYVSEVRFLRADLYSPIMVLAFLALSAPKLH